MSPWLLQLFLGSLGLAVTALAARALLGLWKREPLASYRLLRLVLAVALVLPVLQLAAQHTSLPGLPGAAWLTARLAAVLPQRTAQPKPQVVDGAPREMERILSAEELERIAFALEALQGAAPPGELSVREPAPAPTSSAPAARVERSSVGSEPSVWSALAAIYLAGVALRSGWIVLRVLRTRRLLDAARPVRDPPLLALWEEVRRSSPIGARVELLTTPEIRVPMCSGLDRLVILLPRRAACAPSADVLRCVLLHELVHLERRDGWVVLAQELLQAPFWFHPAARWLHRHLDLFRELSCDARVALRTGNPKRYAAALVEYAEWMQRDIRTPHATSAALLPWTTTHGQLSRRIEMLLSRSKTRPAGPRRFLSGGAYALLPFVWSGQLALASCLSHAQGVRDAHHAGGPCPHGCEAAPAPQCAQTVAPIPAPAPPAPPSAQKVSHRRVAAPTVVVQSGPGAAGGSEAVVVLPPGQNAPLMIAQGQDLPMLGVELGMPDDDQLGGFDADHGPALSVKRVLPGSLAERSGLQDGDILLHVEGQPATLENLNVAKRRLPGGQILLEITRDGEQRVIVIDGHDLHQRHEEPNVWLAPREAVAAPPVPGTPPQPRFAMGGRVQEASDAIARARDALRRAVEAQPDNVALRQALESLEQTDSGRNVPLPPVHVQPFAPDAPLAIFEMGRRMAEAGSRMAEQARRSFYVHEDEDHGHAAHADAGGREQELEELRALLEQRRRELEELRARLERLRAEGAAERSPR